MSEIYINKTYFDPITEWRVYKTMYDEFSFSFRIEVGIFDGLILGNF